MNIYFDGTLVDQNYYLKLTTSNKLFEDSDNFNLGKTLCKTMTLGILSSEVTQIPSVVTVYENDELIGTYEVDSYETDKNTTTFTLADKMIDFNFNYDASTLINESTTSEDDVKYVTLSQILNDICDTANVTLATTSFIGQDKHISWYDNTITARDYIGFIAELNGGYALINNSGELEIRQYSTTSKQTITFDEIEDYTLGEYHKISRVMYDDGLGTYDSVGDETNDTLYINTNNTFITSQDDIQNIYDIINDFEFYCFTTNKSVIYTNVKVGDIITFTDGTNEYKTIAQYDLEYNGGWIGGYSLSVNNSKQEETTIIDNTQTIIKNIKSTVDRTNAQLTLLATDTYTKEEIKEIADGTSEDVEVTYVSTEQGTFSNDGLRIQRLDSSDNTKIISETSTLFNENGMTVSKVENGELSTDSPILFSGYVSTDSTDENLERYKGQSVTASNNMIVNKYLVIGDKSRIEQYTENSVEKTGIFPL